MASIVEQGKSVHARIVRKGYPVQTNTFPIKTLAKAWAGRIEHQMDSGAWIDRCACFAP